MVNKLTLTLLFGLLTMYSDLCYSQSMTENSEKISSTIIEGLSIYPNPISNGKLNILTKNNFSKEVVIYNVLGKEMISERISGNRLDITKLKPGVYIIKVTENAVSATRKLIVS